MSSQSTAPSANKPQLIISIDDGSDNNSLQNTTSTTSNNSTDCSITNNNNNNLSTSTSNTCTRPNMNQNMNTNLNDIGSQAISKYVAWQHIEQTSKGHEGYATSQRILSNMSFNKERNDIQCQCGSRLWTGTGHKKLELTRHLNTSIHKLNAALSSSSKSNIMNLNIPQNMNMNNMNLMGITTMNSMNNNTMNMNTINLNQNQTQNQNNNLNLNQILQTPQNINMNMTRNMNSNLNLIQNQPQKGRIHLNNLADLQRLVQLTNIQRQSQPQSRSGIIQNSGQLKFNKQMSDWAQQFGAKVTEWANDLNNRVTGIEKDLKWVNQKLKERVAMEGRSQNEVGVWLRDTVKLSEYIDVFIENGMENMEVIMLITENELDIMKIDKLGHRMKILNEIKKLKENMDGDRNERKRKGMGSSVDLTVNDDGPSKKRQKLNE